MYVVSSKGGVLIVTPLNTIQFQPLLNSIKLKHNKIVQICIVRHWPIFTKLNSTNFLTFVLKISHIAN